MRSIQIVAVGLIAYSMAACSGSETAGPTEPSAGPSRVASGGPKPTIANISPDSGSIYGGGVVTVVGNIDRQATATLGGVGVSLGWSPADAAVHLFITPAHAAGPVDIVVTNPDGGSQTVVGAYTYVEPGSYQLNGEWAGYTVDGSDTWIEFTVRDQLLTSVRCIDPSDTRLAIDLSQPFVNGKVEVATDAGRFSAWAVSPTETAGTIDMKPCAGMLRWEAELRSSPQRMRR
jgi:IPT/TIG domain